MRKAGDILSALFNDRFGPGFFEQARSLAGLFSAWADTAAAVWPPSRDGDESADEGDTPAVAAHSRIRELERGILLVEADHPGWVQLLQTKQNQLLQSVQRRFPDLEIRGISFCLSREPFSLSGNREKENPPAEDFPSPPSRVGEDPPGAAEIPGGKKDRTGNESFYAALERLEKSVKKRNKAR